MSMHSPVNYSIPEDTIQAAHASFPKGPGSKYLALPGSLGAQSLSLRVPVLCKNTARA